MNFREYLVIEASYKGNIGMTEMFKFYQIADAAQKARMKELITSGQHKEAWDFLKQVTGVELEDA